MANNKRDPRREAFWREAIKRQGSSGLSVREFCRRESLAETSFFAWRRTIRERDAEQQPSRKPPAFVPAVVAAQARPARVTHLADDFAFFHGKLGRHRWASVRMSVVQQHPKRPAAALKHQLTLALRLSLSLDAATPNTTSSRRYMARFCADPASSTPNFNLIDKEQNARMSFYTTRDYPTLCRRPCLSLSQGFSEKVWPPLRSWLSCWRSSEHASRPCEAKIVGFASHRRNISRGQRTRASLWAAYTLVELLVVIAIIAILIALLLPAMQSAREASRRAQCRSQLHQLGVAFAIFEQTYGAYPNGGWGRAWVPVPFRKVGRRQPGGWAYQLLPYLEEGNLFNATGDGEAEQPFTSFSTAVSSLICPSRRGGGPYPVGEREPHQAAPRPGGSPQVVARGDYAINSGASHAFRWRGPANLAQGDNLTYWKSITDNRYFTGVSHLHRSVGVRRVTDGASKTYLAGEKFLEPAHYSSGGSQGDDDFLFSGYSEDNHRFAASRPQGAAGEDPASIIFYPPARDQNLSGPVAAVDYFRFGSAHPVGCQMLMADGSVHTVAYDIDPVVHYFAAHRADEGSLRQLAAP